MSETNETQREVHHISNDVSSRISTAQVIVSVSSAVGQLIDNSLDGCAQVIEIRAKNNGFDSVEVIDDGTGIEADSFDSLCKPHATSKLTGLNDFNQLLTLGFRGEALNALCALSSVTIITRSKSAYLGTKLSFDHSGNIIEQSSAARSVGTTVIIENLFETLPVRRREFEKTAKKQFNKILTTVQCFSLSRPDVKFICSNIVAGKRVQSICTPGNTTTREVVLNLFGGRNDKNKMIDIVRCLPNAEVCSLYGLDPKSTSIYGDIVLSGFVSSCEHGFGRSTADRQFIYINKRPVDYPKICRVINEVYQQYNRSQYPTLVLHIELPPDMIDVNVTPDKKVVFFVHEKELLALIRSSFMAAFNPLLSSCASVQDKTDSDDRHCQRDDATLSNTSKSLSAHSSLFSLPRSSSTKINSSIPGAPNPKRCKTEDNGSTKCTKDLLKTLDDFSFKPLSREKCVSAGSSTRLTNLPKDGSGSRVSDDLNLNHERRKFNPPLMRDLSRGFENSIEKDNAAIERMERAMDQRELSTYIQKEVQQEEMVHKTDTASVGVDQSATFFRPQQKIFFSMSALKERLNNLRDIKVKEEQASQEMDFSAALVPDENKVAEDELNRALRKSDFREMLVIGQFNKGFIITFLRNHLFLVDQHASDEKYNFERFQKKARVEAQPLIHPKPLELGAVQSSVLKDNKDVLEANGFVFKFKDGENGCTTPFLVSAPVLHSWNFDKSDIEEILAFVAEFPGVMYRPAKLRRIFASRACRKSVMIGTALNTSQMQTIVQHLGTLEQPWNCPHGRPTIRHLVDLRNISPSPASAM